MIPVYTDLAAGRSSEGVEPGDEEKLLTSFESLPRSKVKFRLSKYGWHWFTGDPKDHSGFRKVDTVSERPKGFFKDPVVLHLCLILAYSVVCAFAIFYSRQLDQCSSVIYTPAQEAVSREAKILSVKINQTSNIFNAVPSRKVDDAWASLFRYANIRITKDEVDRLGRSSVHLSDGSGDYFGTLDVYHQLHCLKYIRQYVHQDYYTIKDTNVPVRDHVNHCIEMLRQIVMCKADTALMTYEWLPDFPGPWPNFGIQHECVNWEKIDNWSKARAIDIFDPKFLHHPKFGFSYAGHKGSLSNHTD